MNTHLNAKGNLEQVEQFKMAIKVILAPKNETSVREESVRSSHQSLERANFREKFPSVNVIQTSSKNGRSPTAPPHDKKSRQSGMRSKKILQGMEQTNFTKSSSRRKDTTKMTTRTIFFRSYVPTGAKSTATGLAKHSK